MKDHLSQWNHREPKCRDVAERASEYLDDRLPRLTKIRMELHLAFCSTCRIYVQQLGLVASIVRNLPARHPTLLNRLRLRQQFAAYHAHQ